MLTSLATRKTQIKTQIKYQYTPIRLLKIKSSDKDAGKLLQITLALLIGT